MKDILVYCLLLIIVPVIVFFLVIFANWAVNILHIAVFIGNSFEKRAIEKINKYFSVQHVSFKEKKSNDN